MGIGNCFLLKSGFMEKNLKYPVGIQDFEKLRELGYVYADKTPYIRLMTEQPKLYFLSRPRRFIYI